MTREINLTNDQLVVVERMREQLGLKAEKEVYMKALQLLEIYAQAKTENKPVTVCDVNGVPRLKIEI